MEPQIRAYVCALSAVLLWSTVASAFKLALRGMAVAEVLAYATVSSTLALVAVVVAQGKLGAVLRQRPGDWLRSAWLGLLNPLLYYLVLFKAYDLLPAQEAQPLNYTWPIVLSLLSVPLLGQRLRLRVFAALVVSFAGVVVIATRGRFADLRFENPLGCGLAVGSSLIWALFWIGNLRDPRDPVVKLCSSFLFGSVCVLPVVALTVGWRLPEARYVATAAYIGLFEMGFTFVLWLHALRLSRESASVSNLAFLSPFISLAFIRLIVGEEIRLSSVAGLVLIVAGILVQTLGAGGGASADSGGEARGEPLC